MLRGRQPKGANAPLCQHVGKRVICVCEIGGEERTGRPDALFQGMASLADDDFNFIKRKQFNKFVLRLMFFFCIFNEQLQMPFMHPYNLRKI